jgi:hypothetical protein
MNNLQPYKKILLTTHLSFFNADKLWSAIVFAKLLAKTYKTTVDIYMPMPLPVAQITEQVMPTGVNFLEKLDAEHFTISLERKNVRVKQVKWEETADKINLFVYTEKGVLDGDDYAMMPGKPHYDLVVAYGISHISNVKKNLADFFSVWESSDTLNIDINQKNNRYADQNFLVNDAKTYAQAVIHYCIENEIEVSASEATELLSCIYWKTNSLRNKLTNAPVLDAVKQLLLWGADLSKAVINVYSTLSLIETKARQEALTNFKLSADKIAISTVSSDTARQLKNVLAINPDRNPLFEFKEALVSFILLPIQPEQTLVIGSSKSNKYNLKSIFSDYQYIGDDLLCEITVPLNTADTESLINNRLDLAKAQSSINKVVKPEAAAPQPKVETPQVTRKESADNSAELVAADPLAPAVEEIVPDPAPAGDSPQPLFGNSSNGGGGNPFGAK